MHKTYLGDDVYIEFDGNSLVLTTENGLDVTNRIVLESIVYRSLLDYVTFLKVNVDKIKRDFEGY